MPAERPKRLFTVAAHDPRELTQLLAARLAVDTAAAAQLLAEGAVFVGGRRVHAATRKLSPGERVTVYLAAASAQAAPAALQIVLADEDVLVVDKPAGLETLPGRRGGPSLQQLLPAGATPLHRLDAEASGLVLCARSHAAAAVLQPALASGRISREYAAVVRGAPPDSGRIDLRIGARAGGQPMAARRQCYPADATQGQAATTLFQTLGRRRDDAGQPQALLQVELQSGRTHQIRVHLATLGFPIVGDRLYGDGDQAAGRLLLHAQRLRFRHPRTGRPCLAVSPPPPEFGWPTAHATPAAAPPTA